MNEQNHRRLVGEIVAATHNKGKLAEFRDLFEPLGIEVVGAGALGLPEPEETGDTFVANALIKARAATEATGKISLADDSGICVVGLDGAPGIYSARWAGGGGKDFAPAMARIARELEARDVVKPRRAYFISVLALAWPDGHVETFEGRVDGDLTFPPRGTAGFGYDPMFIPDGHSRTFGEMTAAEKHGLPADGSLALSHRARAFQLLALACL
jgi:XTP/dITP diphosphohydrolase